jgi:FeoC like transcriptional regulator
MLEKLLSELRAGGTFETGELAVRLGTTPELLGAMLEHLQRSGYIQPYRTCGDACGGCSISKECRNPNSEDSSNKPLRLFTVQIP